MITGIGSIIGAGISAIGGLAGSYMNNKAQKEADERNLQFQRENLDYQKHLQQQVFEREDTAHQREVKDLRAAGLNPLLSTGSGAGAGSVVPTESLHSSYTPDYSGITQGAIAAGQGIANAERYQQDLAMRRELQKEQIANMRAQRQQTAVATMRNLLGYETDNAHLEEWYSYGEHRKTMADYEEESKKLDNLERSGRISHQEAENRRQELASQREEGIYGHNMEYAKNHNLPYGNQSQGVKYLADTIADIFGHKEGGTDLAHDVLSGVVDSAKSKVSDVVSGLSKAKGKEGLMYTAVDSMQGKSYDEVRKAFESAARMNGYKLKNKDYETLKTVWKNVNEGPVDAKTGKRVGRKK